MKPVAGTGKIGFVGAVLIHGLLLAAIFIVEPAGPSQAQRKPPVRVKLVKRSAAAATPVAAAETKKETAKPKPKPKPKIAKTKSPAKRNIPKQVVSKPIQPNKVNTAGSPFPTKPNSVPAKPITPRKFTVSMEATVATGSVAVPTSEQGFAFGTPDGDPDAEPRLLPQSQAQEGLGKINRDVTRVLPKLVASPSYAQMRALYPKQALLEGIEANVGLKVLISASGKVLRVRVVRPAAKEFDKVAVSLVRRFEFQPAQEDGQPVSMWIPWTYKFRLDG